jgi:predicted enzyme related to lactoylglutathione lyase
MKKMDPVVHFEFPAKDLERIKKFYEGVFGWETKQLGEDMGSYVLVTTVEKDEKTGFPKEPGRINGGFYKMTDDPISRYPSVVIAVDNIEESMKKVEKAGGKISGKIQEIPGTGRILSIIDTEGSRLSLLQPNPMPAKS